MLRRLQRNQILVPAVHQPLDPLEEGQLMEIVMGKHRLEVQVVFRVLYCEVRAVSHSCDVLSNCVIAEIILCFWLQLFAFSLFSFWIDDYLLLAP